ncbi:MAG: TRAP transporter substrate-binding protein [Eubacteriales bacterium]|nr:TRAP transporter substrate-binding protein [Eubacteriales bacterium]
MKKRTKQIVAVVLGTAMAASMVGCGSKAEEAPAAASTAAASEAVAETAATSAAPAAGDVDYTQGDKMEIKIGTVLTEASISGQALQMFADELKEKSGGRVTATVYYNGVLADSDASFEMLQTGDIQMLTLNPVAYETQVTQLATLDEYYMFDDLAHAHRFLEGEGGQYLNDAWQSVNMQGLCVYGLGFRELSNNKKEVKTMEDMKGLTLRGYSTIQIDAWNAAGASPTSVDWNELFVSMQQGLLDGQESALSTINDFSFYEVQKYVTLTDHVFTMDWVVGSKVWLDGLNETDRALVDECIKDSYEWQKDAYQKDLQNLADKFTNEYGLTITEMDPAEKEKLKEAMQPVTVESIKAAAGEDVYNTVHEYVEAAR